MDQDLSFELSTPNRLKTGKSAFDRGMGAN